MIRWLVPLCIAIILTGSLSSCGNAPAGGDAAADSAAMQGLQVTSACAVFYTPDEARQRWLKKQFGEKNFEGIANANLQYMNAARQFLSAQKVQIVNTSQYQLHFVKKNGQVVSLDLNRPKYSWEIFLFNGYDDPVKIDMTNVEEEYRNARMTVNN